LRRWHRGQPHRKGRCLAPEALTAHPAATSGPSCRHHAGEHPRLDWYGGCRGGRGFL